MGCGVLLGTLSPLFPQGLLSFSLLTIFQAQHNHSLTKLLWETQPPSNSLSLSGTPTSPQLVSVPAHWKEFHYLQRAALVVILLLWVHPKDIVSALRVVTQLVFLLFSHGNVLQIAGLIPGLDQLKSLSSIKGKTREMICIACSKESTS